MYALTPMDVGTRGGEGRGGEGRGGEGRGGEGRGGEGGEELQVSCPTFLISSRGGEGRGGEGRGGEGEGRGGEGRGGEGRGGEGRGGEGRGGEGRGGEGGEELQVSCPTFLISSREKISGLSPPWTHRNCWFMIAARGRQSKESIHAS